MIDAADAQPGIPLEPEPSSSLEVMIGMDLAVASITNIRRYRHMSTTKIIGILLIVAGVLGLVYGGWNQYRVGLERWL